MVDRADLIISYIEHNQGGAYKTVKYAMENNKEIINFAGDDTHTDPYKYR
jgi:hypothetical protein